MNENKMYQPEDEEVEELIHQERELTMQLKRKKQELSEIDTALGYVKVQLDKLNKNKRVLK